MKDAKINQSLSKCILFFVKYPKKGQVKSRLSAEFDETLTVELYKKFVNDLLVMLNKTEITIVICYHPKESLEKFKEWLGSHYFYLPQRGNNLGQRMKNSFIDAFNIDFKLAVIIGSDSPDLPVDYLKDAFLSLEMHDAVIGPCADGGYYLIGFKHNTFLQSAFEKINWSSETVFSETMNILSNESFKIRILPEWTDVDTLKDLIDLYERNKNEDFNSSETMSFLSENLQNLD